MERKLKEILDSCDLNVFEMINLAIQVASRLYPAEFALRRDHIIERLYSSSDVMGQDAARVSDKKAQVATKGGVGSSQRPIAGQGQRSTDPKGKGKMEFSEKHQGSTDPKGKGKMEISKKPGTCARNKSLKISEIESQPAPVGTRQGQSSAVAKGKGKIPYTEFVPRHAEGYNMRNNQVRSNELKGKNIAPATEKGKKHGGMNCNKSLSIGGKVVKKLDGASRGSQGSSQHANWDEQDLTILDDVITISDGSSDEKEAEDPLDWWVDEDILYSDCSASDDGGDMENDDAKLKGSNGPDDA